MSHTDTIEKDAVKLKRPSKWAIIVHNDDVTTMDFVVALLTQIFGHDGNAATEITIHIHLHGKGVAGVYSHEIAEQKYNDAKTFIQMFSQPLKISLEKE